MSEKKRIIAKTVEEALEKARKVYRLNMDEMTYTVVQQPSKGIFGIGSKDAIIEVVSKNAAPAPSSGAGKPAVAKAPEKPAVQKTPEKPVAVKKPEAPAIHKAAEVPAVAKPAKKPAVQKPERTEIIIEEAETVSLDDAFEQATSAVAEAAKAAPESAEEIGLAFLGPIFKALAVEPVVHVSEDDKTIRFDISGPDVGILIGRHGETLNAIQFLLSLVVNSRLASHKSVVFDVENYRERRVSTLEKIAHRQASKCRKTGRRVTLNPMNAAERRIIHLVVEKEAGVTSYSEGNEPHRRVVIVAE